ncbi:sensor histidine kinase [Actinokineospora sp.]|uniref:sensor histidine kinase n=1 Tax=Actinokineospora sp. TaxID=1872133 RepID=UPI004037FD18
MPRLARVLGGELLVVGIPLAAVLLSHPTAFAFAVPTAVIACLALPLRLRLPWLVMLVCLPALVGGLGWPPAIVALFRIGRTAPRIRAAAVWVVVGFLAIAIPVQFSVVMPVADRIMSLMFALVAIGCPAALGVLVRLRGDLAASLAEVERARKAELEARLDRARAEERNRIAREIHDAVGHHATLIAVQAAALSATTDDPRAKETADRLRELAKQSLAEMRAALGLAAVDQRGIADLPDLVTRARGAGLAVTFAEEPAADSSTPAVGRAVYRVVQEALTNTVKHAPGAPVDIRLVRDAQRIIVSVVNGAPRHPADTVDSGGTGLEGLIERVHNVGGTFRAEPLPNGGFSVLADLPALPTKVGPNPSTSGGGSPLRAGR